LLELDTSADPEDVALLERMRAGAHTRRDVRRVCDLIEAHVERSRQRRAN